MSLKYMSPGAVEHVFAALQKEFHELMIEKGWHNADRGFPEEISLMHAELSESLEEFRKHGMAPEKFFYMEHGKPEGIAVELADVLYRIFDAAAKYDLPLGPALIAKHGYNQTRPFRHGNKHA